jgi:hypothetical protein
LSAESKRERRAKIINAKDEFQAAEELVEAAWMISAQPIALQLRFLETMREISSEHRTTTILAVPLALRNVAVSGCLLREVLQEFLDSLDKRRELIWIVLRERFVNI